MKNRRLDHLRDVRAYAERARVRRHRGEADLIVDHDVDGATGAVALELGNVQHFRHDPLACEGCVAMDEQGQHRFALLGSAEFPLPRARLALDHRVDRFEVAWVGSQADRDFASPAAVSRVIS